MKTSFRKDLLDIALSVTHLRSGGEIVFNFVITVLSFIVAHYTNLIVINANAFMAIGSVVFFDWLVGSVKAIKNGVWETKKSMKVVYYFVAYSFLLATILSVEKGYPSAFWVSEAVMTPILTFQIISIVKNLQLLGIIQKGLLFEILDKIDGYKSISSENVKNNLETENQ